MRRRGRIADGEGGLFERVSSMRNGEKFFLLELGLGCCCFEAGRE